MRISDLLKKYALLSGLILVLVGLFYLNRYSRISRVERGKILYAAHCANCHGEKGEGLKKLIPPLAGSDYIHENISRLPCIIRYGISGPISVNGQTYNQPMAGIRNLEADEIKAVMDYMLSEWYPEKESLSQAEVSRLLKACEN
jgi:mono/diheme cytochrome c family protein